MQSTGFGTVLFRAGVVGVFVCGVVAASPKLVAWHRAGLARSLAEELSTLETPEAKRAVLRIAALDISGLPQLLDAAASPREAVAREARLSASRQLMAWQTRYTGEALANRLTALIVGIEQRVDRMSDAGQRWAEQVALQVVQLADQAPARQSAVLIRSAGEVLAATPPSGPRLRNVTSRPAATAPASATPALGEFVASLVPPSTPGLPSGVAEVSEPMGASDAVPSAERLPKADSGPLAWGNPTMQESVPPSAAVPMAKPTEPSLLRKETAESEGRRSDTPSERLANTVPSPGELLLMASRLRRLPSSELVRRMSGSDRYEAEQARRILAERGIGEQQIQRASDFFSSDPAVRLRAVDSLAGWPPGEARAWLRAMLEDPNAEVRVRALTQLAVANDPRVVEFARELEQRDPDRSVADTASRILKEIAR